MRLIKTSGLIIFSLLLVGCSNEKSAAKTAVLMNTAVTAAVYGADEYDAEKILDVVKECEDELTDNSFSDSDALNMLDSIRSDSDGMFDVSIGTLTKLWGIGTENARVPSQEEIDAALKDRTVLDPGAFGKGYACDRIKEYLDSSDIPGACVAVGGSILCYGSRDGIKNGAEGYTVAVRDPDGNVDDYVATFSVRDAVVSTSGDYEHVFEQDGKKYHHILNAKTGYPVESGLRSVTVISESGLVSDALSTAAFLLGPEEGRKLLEKYNAEGIFIDKENNVFATNGVKLTLQKGSR